MRSSPPPPDEKVVPLTDALVSGLRKLELYQNDITAEDVVRALGDRKKKERLTKNEVHAISMTFVEIDVEIFEDVATVSRGESLSLIRGTTRSALRRMHARGISLFARKGQPDRRKK